MLIRMTTGYWQACLIDRMKFGERHKNKNPQRISDEGFWNSILTMTYSHMGKPHTTIGDTS
ncbi:hypothetical protein, partial [Pseudomonas tremae]